MLLQDGQRRLMDRLEGRQQPIAAIARPPPLARNVFGAKVKAGEMVRGEFDKWCARRDSTPDIRFIVWSIQLSYVRAKGSYRGLSEQLTFRQSQHGGNRAAAVAARLLRCSFPATARRLRARLL
jgi:hypothetical protein